MEIHRRSIWIGLFFIVTHLQLIAPSALADPRDDGKPGSWQQRSNRASPTPSQTEDPVLRDELAKETAPVAQPSSGLSISAPSFAGHGIPSAGLQLSLAADLVPYTWGGALQLHLRLANLNSFSVVEPLLGSTATDDTDRQWLDAVATLRFVFNVDGGEDIIVSSSSAESKEKRYPQSLILSPYEQLLGDFDLDGMVGSGALFDVVRYGASMTVYAEVEPLGLRSNAVTLEIEPW